MSSEFDDEYDNIYTLPPLEPARFLTTNILQFASLEEAEWIIDEIIPQGELAVIFGAPGCGKSFMALDMAMCIAMGREWNRNRTTQGRVVYIAAEGAHGFKKRTMAYLQHHSLFQEIIPLDIIADSPNFLKDIDALKIVESINKGSKPTVIIVDTLSRTMPGGNENSGEHMGHAIEQCKIIHQLTGAIVILIHHSGKDGDRGSRGWSGLLGALDTEIEVKKLPNGHVAKITKQKDGEDGLEWGFDLDVVQLGDNKFGKPITSCVYMPSNSIPIAEIRERQIGLNEQRVLDVFKAMGSSYVPLEDLITEAIKGLIQDPQKRDTRRQHIVRAISALHNKNKILVVGDMVSWN